MPRIARRSRGFTLIEVVLAMILVAMIMAIAVGAIRMSRKAAERGEQRIEAVNSIRVTQEFVRRQLSRSVPLAFAADRREGRNHVFAGKEREITFVAPMPGYLSSGGPYVQSLSIERGRLVFNHRLLLGDEDDAAEPVFLLDRIRRGRFEFRGIDERGRLGDWRDDWEDPSRTPMMVRLSIDFDRDSGLTWPVLEVPLLIDVGGVNNAYRFFGGDDQAGMEASGIIQPMTPEGQPVPQPPVGNNPNAER
ncbi:MAG: prepilin-type N-terminal cleavage/methylation domain-containing protein [Xanthomonadales bacterium]|nr:prepilin-type N-terminal cleavage/methylation domain-containing protein [Xanthomonadales bacterium]